VTTDYAEVVRIRCIDPPNNRAQYHFVTSYFGQSGHPLTGYGVLPSVLPPLTWVRRCCLPRIRSGLTFTPRTAMAFLKLAW
jgi:hypothetical protein